MYVLLLINLELSLSLSNDFRIDDGRLKYDGVGGVGGVGVVIG